jgi:predicted SprT family Zn-dependent metalloprotease
MKKKIENIEKPFHDKIMEMECCGNKIKYNKRIDMHIQGTVETYWCPKCGFSLTKTLGYIDENEMPN